MKKSVDTAPHLHDVIAAALRRARIRGTFFGILTFSRIRRRRRRALAGRPPGSGGESHRRRARLVPPVRALRGRRSWLAGVLFGAYQEAVGAARRVFDLLEAESSVKDPIKPLQLPRPLRGEIAMDNVTFQYNPTLAEGSARSVAQDQRREVVALVGPSGAGKTTIASLLPRFWDVTGGRITFDGIDIRDLSLAELRGAIGIVPQEPTLFSGTIRENIAYAGIGDDGSRPSEEAIVAAAKAAHAVEFIERLPDGFDTRVGERGVKLSGGQRQRHRNRAECSSRIRLW